MTSGPALIPAPTSLTLLEGRLTLPPRLPTSGPLPWVDTLRTLLTPGSGLAVDQTLDESTALVRLVERASVVGPPGSYDLTVDGSGVTLVSPDRAGLVHAVATLRQLLPAWACGPAPVGIASISLPHLRIHDEPHFAWRGMHLDVGRHFQPLDSLLRFVDLLALHKFNVFHLHLTEDQGWRFEVTAYPRLTEVGAARPETRLPAWATGDGTPHGGYYTQAQLRALVAYAAERGITVVPEIDLPGHVRALLAAYPEFGEPTAPATTVATTVGVFPEVLHLADATVAMIETVLAELLDVFPSPDIHIGGDECPREQWRGSAAAGVLAAERGLSDVDLLQQWFTTHLRDWLASRGRRLVGWDEIIDDGPLTDTLVMSWQGSEPGARAMAQGNDVVLCAPPYYFDHYQSTDPEEPYAIGGLATWQDVLTTDPYAGVAAPLRPHLLGVQGQVWTEYLPTPRHVDYATWPRAAALAEVAWAGPSRSARRDGRQPTELEVTDSEDSDSEDTDSEDTELDALLAPEDAVTEFESRLRVHLARLDAAAVDYRPLDGPRPWQRGGTGRWARP